MILESVKTSDKREVIALLERYCESSEELYISMQHLDGEYRVEVLRPTKTAVSDAELQDATPL
jgi:hypothetical protein